MSESPADRFSRNRSQSLAQEKVHASPDTNGEYSPSPNLLLDSTMNLKSRDIYLLDFKRVPSPYLSRLTRLLLFKVIVK